MKKLIKLAVVALLAVIVLVILGAYFLDSMIKKGVETVGPKITQTKVTLTRAKVSPWSGRGELVGFVVGNPEGYKTPSALSLGLISLEVKPRSFMEDKIVIRSFIAQSPEITLEGGLKENNLSEILDNVNALTSGQEEKPPKPDEPKGESAETRVQVDHFLIKGAVVKVSVKGMLGQTFDVRLPDVELRNLGQNEEGITVAELSRLVLSAILEKTIDAAGDGLGGSAGETLKSLKEGDVGKAAESIQNLFKKD